MRRRTIAAMLVSSCLSAVATCDAVAAEPPPAAAGAPAYTLEVESDDPAAVSFDAIAPRLAAELGAPVAPATRAAARAAITIRYRARTLTVRAAHPGRAAVERSIAAEGDVSAVRSEAVLLAGNLARDEARELLDELTRPPPPPPAEPEPPREPAPARAEPPAPEERWLATFAVLYPLATNARHPDVRSLLDVSLFYGRVGRVAGLQIGTLTTMASRDLSGAALAGLVSVVGGSVDGAQLATGAAFAGGRVHGAQLGTLVTMAGGDVAGTQLAAGVTYARGRLEGAQLSAIANVATERAHGVQVAAGVNVAPEVEGLQMAVINVGRDVGGAQIGIVNVGRKVKGLQLGLVNIAEDVGGAALGLVSVSRDAFHPLVWGGNLSYANVGIKWRSRYAYTIVGVGAGTREIAFDGPPTFTTAIGGRIPLGAFDIEIQTAYSIAASGTRSNQATHVHAIGGYAFAKHLRLFAGAGPRIPLDFERGDNAVRPEVLAGVQF